ncbi:MAG: c-type cytochrome [Acidobacteriaceae bacterium]|jgi:thiosulfate dehydrogenase|nr:c-type cytochrome [Acidobacteriaceae bacterium]
MRFQHISVLAALLLTVATLACQGREPAKNAFRYKLSGPLIPAKMTMVTAWDFPKNPLTDDTLDTSKLSSNVRLGFEIFTDTPRSAPAFVPGKISCNNCHLNGGQRERALPLVGIAGQFPEYNRRAGRLISLNDRIVDCFLRSQNATGRLTDGSTDQSVLPTPTSKEVLAVSAYLAWISRGTGMGATLAWRGQNAIPNDKLIPLASLDRAKGEAIYTERCTNCHGADGQGVTVGDKRPGPLWGNDSWNDGARAGRIYTLAGIIRWSMPYLDPGSLTDEDAQQLAAFIDSKPRPAYPFKDRDYLVDPLPPDSVYYPPRTAAGK